MVIRERLSLSVPNPSNYQLVNREYGFQTGNVIH